jgi:glycosyltransferase involved in cell wall biosynthesis
MRRGGYAFFASRRCDIFTADLCNSIMPKTTLPFKVQSYMATGKPIIGAINGETRMVIEEAQCGLCCDAEDHVGLAAIVKEFADNRGRYLGCGASARAYCNVHFRKTDFMERLVRLLTETREGVR